MAGHGDTEHTGPRHAPARASAYTPPRIARTDADQAGGTRPHRHSPALARSAYRARSRVRRVASLGAAQPKRPPPPLIQPPPLSLLLRRRAASLTLEPLDLSEPRSFFRGVGGIVVARIRSE